ncbi:STOREKEEPER protein-like [Telopea speciosissima]|uniref:STOREKEEPER protein-like n=1 Tax=Telopea speciosissima TaxID=54955 RepID=UPI001CC5C7AA|nr:STOREKEEPER protein-like [Telopea speciosissima]
MTEEEDDEDDDEEGDEDEQVNATPQPSVKKNPSSVNKTPVKAVHPPTPSSGSGPDTQLSDGEDDGDSSTESGSDSESPEKPARPSRSADPNIKPISSKPMDDGPKSKKPAAMPSAASSLAALPAKSRVAAKRPAESDIDKSKNSKRGKRKPSDDELDAGVSEDAEKKPGDDRKKQLFQRVWTEDDELAILKGMLDYFSMKGTDPSTDMNAFHEYIKKSFHVEFTRNQLADKIRRLKKKYRNNVGKGKDPVFSKPHEHKAFELSKKIWGADAANDVVNDQTAKNVVCNGKFVGKPVG